MAGALWGTGGISSQSSLTAKVFVPFHQVEDDAEKLVAKLETQDKIDSADFTKLFRGLFF